MTDVLLNVNVIQSIDDFFTKIFSSLKEAITWNTFWTLIAGIVIGFVICSTIYGILLMNSISKKEKEIENTKKDIDDDKISNIVEQIKNSYVEESEGLSVTSRFDILGKKDKSQIKRAISTYNSSHGIIISNTKSNIVKEDNIIYLPPETFAFM